VRPEPQLHLPTMSDVRNQLEQMARQGLSVVPRSAGALVTALAQAQGRGSTQIGFRPSLGNMPEAGRSSLWRAPTVGMSAPTSANISAPTGQASKQSTDWRKGDRSKYTIDPKYLRGVPNVGVGSGLYVEEKYKTPSLLRRSSIFPEQSQSPRPARDPYSVDNLSLGPNDALRPMISAAGARHGWPPHTAAAIIDAEALKNGKGVWNIASQSGGSTASGPTQFLENTWIGNAERRGSYLNNRARELGWLDKNGRIAPAHRKEFLDLRFNATDSVNAALEYASDNIDYLRRRGLILDNSPAALARYAYIAHHEGPAGAAAYLRGEPLQISDDKWTGNITSPKMRAKYLAANGNDRSAAYRAYMDDYIDGRIDPRHFMVDSTGVEVPSTGTLYAPPRGRPRLPNRLSVPTPNAKQPTQMLRRK
jgi:hypothetical protein